MTNETRLFLELWNAVRDHLTKPVAEDVLSTWFTAFEDFGIEPEELVDLLGEEKILESAYRDMYETEEEEIDDEEEELY